MLLLHGHIALRWSAVLGRGGGYKHMAALRPIHNYTTRSFVGTSVRSEIVT